MRVFHPLGAMGPGSGVSVLSRRVVVVLEDPTKVSGLLYLTVAVYELTFALST